MYKKIIILIISMILLVGCKNTNINKLSLQEIIDTSIKSEVKDYNINAKGYRYYLPTEFSVVKDEDYIQQLLSKNNIYYLNVDIVSYYYKNVMASDRSLDDYDYYEFEKDNKKGYMRITKNNDYFFVTLCYNYAIIEVEVKQDELRYAISRSIVILNSIKYNDKVIEKYINDNDIDSSETVYKIPEPVDKNQRRNVLEYIEEYEESD